MIKEFLESLKIKDIVFFVLLIVLFCMYFKKNKKEGFAGQISDANLQAINNLGQMVKTISDSSGKLTLNELVIQDGDKNVNVLDTLKAIQVSVSNDRADFDNHVEDINNTLTEYIKKKTGGQGNKNLGNHGWGSGRTHQCPKGQYVNRIGVQFESSQGGGDDTGVNGFWFSCANLDQ
jgi:hypothetical protein